MKKVILGSMQVAKGDESSKTIYELSVLQGKSIAINCPHSKKEPNYYCVSLLANSINEYSSFCGWLLEQKKTRGRRNHTCLFAYHICRVIISLYTFHLYSTFEKYTFPFLTCEYEEFREAKTNTENGVEMWTRAVPLTGNVFLELHFSIITIITDAEVDIFG